MGNHENPCPNCGHDMAGSFPDCNGDWCLPQCSCPAIREALRDGHPNPESMEEYRQAHRHYPGCGRLNVDPRRRLYERVR